MLIGIPVRGFTTAKQRLSETLSPADREELARQLATHTVSIARTVGTVVIATSDPQVTQWCGQQNLATIDDGGTLNGAAQAIARHAASAPWAVLHADLPGLQAGELSAALEAFQAHGGAFAPSWDGGTSLIVLQGADFTFSYGPGSFHRHFAQHPTAAVIVRPGLALDVDEPAHLIWMQDRYGPRQ